MFTSATFALRCACVCAVWLALCSATHVAAQSHDDHDDHDDIGLHMTQAPSTLSGHSPQRLDLTRWLTTPEAGSWGVSLGVAASPPARGYPSTRGATASWEPTVGLHWRTPLGQGRHLDISTWAHLAHVQPQPYTSDLIWSNYPNNYATQVEVQWRSPRFGGLLPEFGAIGVKLEGQGQLVLRARSGGAMLYYRTKF